MFKFDKTELENNFVRVNVKFNDISIFTFDYKMDKSRDMQIYFNTEKSKINPSNNNFPNKWYSYKFNSPNFIKNKFLGTHLNHISFHPRDNKANLGRRTNIHFNGENKPFVVIGKDKSEEFFPFFHIFISNNVNHAIQISFIQKFTDNAKSNLMKDVIDLELIAAKNGNKNQYYELLKYIKDNIGYKLNINEFFSESKKLLTTGKSKEWIDEFQKGLTKHPVGLEGEFYIYNNCTVRCSEIIDEKYIEFYKDFFDVYNLNLFVIGNIQYAANSNSSDYEGLVIGYYDKQILLYNSN
jgi:hypothetical protein